MMGRAQAMVAAGAVLGACTSPAAALEIDPGFRQVPGPKAAYLALTVRFLCPADLADGAIQLTAARSFRSQGLEDVACSYGSKTGLGFATFYLYPDRGRGLSQEMKETTELIASRAGIRNPPRRSQGQIQWGPMPLALDDAQLPSPGSDLIEAVWLASYRGWRVKARRTYEAGQAELLRAATGEFMALQIGAVAQLDACAAQQTAFDANRRASVLQGAEVTGMAGVMALTLPSPQPTADSGCAIGDGALPGGRSIVLRSYGSGQVLADARIEGDPAGAVWSLYRMDFPSMQPSLGGLLVQQSQGETVVYRAYGAPPGPGQSVADLAAVLAGEISPMARIKDGEIALSMPDEPAGR